MSLNQSVVTRRLAAILIADVVGYTRLMERDDTGTFSRLRTIRDEVVDPAIVSHGGRIVKTAGDGLMAEFTSAVAAMRAAVQIQGEMAARNAGVASDERIDYRIGVNLGDVMDDGSEMAGDGVNVAARLETLADPGDICVSGAVREQVHGNLDVEFEDIGEQRVKNIARPIRVYRVATAGAPTRAKRKPLRLPGSRRMWTWAGIVFGVSAVATAGLLMLPRTTGTAAEAPPMSIAILPFDATADGVAAATLAQRLTGEVITVLSRGKRSARVMPYPLIAEYNANSADPRVVGRALNVRYVAEGDVRISKPGATLTTRLYDTATANQLSTHTTQVTESNLNERDDMLVARAAYQIRSALGAAERNRARSAPGDSTLDLLARAGAIMQAENYSLAATREALNLVDEVLKREPNNVTALVRRFWCLNNIYEEDLHADRDRIVEEMEQATSRAVAVDPRDAEAWHARSITFAWQGRGSEAEEALAEAQRLDPANPDYVEQHAFLMYVTGRPVEAIALVEQSMARTGSHSDGEMRDLCWYNLALGRYADATPACEKATALSGWWQDEMTLAAAYGQAGQLDKSKEAAMRLIRAKPDVTIDLLRKRRYSSHPDYRRLEEEGLFAGLRKAGIPEK